MSSLPKAYKVCKIKIKRDVSKKKIIIKKFSKTLKEPVDIVNFSKEKNQDNKLIGDSTQEKNISLCINNLIKKETHYKNHYITITICYNFRVTKDKIDSLKSMHLIGTNILTKIKDTIPFFKISNPEDVKYKKLVREKAKELWDIKNKHILSIKHINNYKNFHNYLVFIDVENKSTKKFIKKFKNRMHSIKDEYCWRTYFGIFSPNSLNPSKREVYSSLAKSTIKTIHLNSIETKKLIELPDIYKSISFCIGDELY